MCSISDGAYVSNALPGDEFKSNLERMWIPNKAIVMCTLARVDKKILLVETLEVVRTDVEKQIGDPKFIADYKNGRRDCSSIWTTLPPPPKTLGTLIKIPEEDEPENSSQENLTEQKSNPPNGAPKNPPDDRDQYSTADEEDRAPDDSDLYMPISLLTIYSIDPMIKGRIIDKGQLRKVKDGKDHVMNIEIMDDSQKPRNVIKGTLWGAIAEKYYQTLDEKTVYIFSNFTTNFKNRKFTHNQHDVEIKFHQSAEIVSAKGGNKHIPMHNYAVLPLDTLQGMRANSDFSTIAVISKVGDIEELKISNGRVVKKQELQICDDTWDRSVRVTLWEDQIPTVEGHFQESWFQQGQIWLMVH